MIKFETEGQPIKREPIVQGSLIVDGDGNLCLQVNGISIAYLFHDGVLGRFKIEDPHDRQILSEMGIELNADDEIQMQCDIQQDP